MSVITSRQHAFVQRARQVARGDAELSLLDGWHLIGDALDAGLDLEEAAIAADADDDEAARTLARLADTGTPVWRVSDAVMNALSPVRTPSGAIALVRRRQADVAQLVAPAPALVVVCVDMQDPGNVGATVRAAEAGGATGVWLAGDSADPWSWKALRAAMGSTFRLPVRRTSDVVATCDTLRQYGLRLVSTVPRSGLAMEAVDLRAATALFLGGEGPGLHADLLARADAGISIPMRAPVDSLNVAVAAALLVYEARRQRLS